MKKIAVVGTGYVGLSNAILLAQYNEVWAVDIIPEKVEEINQRRSPIIDAEIEDYLKNRELHLQATLDADSAYRDAEYIIVSTPTNYDPQRNSFNTSSVETVVGQALKVNRDAILIIKSTVPVGFTAELCRKYGTENIMFAPEFLREGHALYDNLYPSRIVIGTAKNNLKIREKAKKFAELLQKGAIKKEISVLYMDLT